MIAVAQANHLLGPTMDSKMDVRSHCLYPKHVMLTRCRGPTKPSDVLSMLQYRGLFCDAVHTASSRKLTFSQSCGCNARGIVLHCIPSWRLYLFRVLLRLYLFQYYIVFPLGGYTSLERCRGYTSFGLQAHKWKVVAFITIFSFWRLHLLLAMHEWCL